MPKNWTHVVIENNGVRIPENGTDLDVVAVVSNTGTTRKVVVTYNIDQQNFAFKPDTVYRIYGRNETNEDTPRAIDATYMRKDVNGVRATVTFDNGSYVRVPKPHGDVVKDIVTPDTIERPN